MITIATFTDLTPTAADTHADLVRIEADIQKATHKHNEFLKELGKRLLPTAE